MFHHIKNNNYSLARQWQQCGGKWLPWVTRLVPVMATDVTAWVRDWCDTLNKCHYHFIAGRIDLKRTHVVNEKRRGWNILSLLLVSGDLEVQKKKAQWFSIWCLKQWTTMHSVQELCLGSKTDCGVPSIGHTSTVHLSVLSAWEHCLTLAESANQSQYKHVKLILFSYN